MSVFRTTGQAREVFTQLFEILLKDERFVERLRSGGLSVHLVQPKPDLEFFVDPDRVLEGPPPTPASVRIAMSCDTAHSMWQGKVRVQPWHRRFASALPDCRARISAVTAPMARSSGAADVGASVAARP